jgi:membrane-bound lytic murein transglycosylase D
MAHHFKYIVLSILLFTPVMTWSKVINNPVSFCGEPVHLSSRVIILKMDYFIKMNRREPRRMALLKVRLELFKPYILEALKKYRLPADFQYLPLVESAYNNVRSKAGATGIWQLMPETARGYGLYVKSERDDRLYFIKATEAACRFLRDLHELLRNWTLVAAAYNLGPNGLIRRMSQQRETDYYRLKLPKETSEYVYRIIAVKLVLNSK